MGKERSKIQGREGMTDVWAFTWKHMVLGLCPAPLAEPTDAPPSWLGHSMAPSCLSGYGSKCHSTGRARNSFVQSTQDLSSAPFYLP